MERNECRKKSFFSQHLKVETYLRLFSKWLSLSKRKEKNVKLSERGIDLLTFFVYFKQLAPSSGLLFG